MAKVALRFGCAKQSKDLEWCLLNMNVCPPETIGGKFLKKLHKHLMADKDDDENPMFTHKFCIRKVFRIKSKNI